MATMKERLQSDLNDAMRARDDVRRSTVLITAVKNAGIAGMHPLNDSEVVAVTRSQAKQRDDSITEFKKAGRQDLVDREQVELEILLTYLPQLAGRDVVDAAAHEGHRGNKRRFRSGHRQGDARAHEAIRRRRRWQAHLRSCSRATQLLIRI